MVQIMRDHGFTWGGTWLVPDPAHYEVIPTD
ncbi:MAG: M15 family metallopeptidase [Euzebya sp.]